MLTREAASLGGIVYNSWSGLPTAILYLARQGLFAVSVCFGDSGSIVFQGK